MILSKLSTPKLLLHKKQQEIWLDKNRFKVIVCGRRFGKTHYVREKLSFLTNNRNHLYWYVAPTYSLAKDLLWEPLKERWDALGWLYQKDESRLMIKRMKTRTVIQLKSAQKERSLRGKGLDGVFLDEMSDIPLQCWTHAIRPALSDKRGFAEFLGTPKGMNHFYDLFNNAKSRKTWSAFLFKTIDSPLFQTEEGLKEIEDAKMDLDPKTFKQEYEASFESFAGRIIYAFDRSKHNTDYKYDPSLPIYVGQDFNRNPMAGVLFQKVSGKMIAFAEMVIPTSSTQEICDIIKQTFPNWMKHGVIFRPDATGSRMTSNSSKSDHAIIKESGFKVETKFSNPRRVDRWAACNKALEQGVCLINIKKCPKLTRELENLCYKESTCEIDLKDPSMGHVFDAFGYNIHTEYPVIQRLTPKVYSY